MLIAGLELLVWKRSWCRAGYCWMCNVTEAGLLYCCMDVQGYAAVQVKVQHGGCRAAVPPRCRTGVTAVLLPYSLNLGKRLTGENRHGNHLFVFGCSAAAATVVLLRPYHSSDTPHQGLLVTWESTSSGQYWGGQGGEQQHADAWAGDWACSSQDGPGVDVQGDTRGSGPYWADGWWDSMGQWAYGPTRSQPSSPSLRPMNQSINGCGGCGTA